MTVVSTPFGIQKSSRAAKYLQREYSWKKFKGAEHRDIYSQY